MATISRTTRPKGCVIMAPNIRQQIATSNDHDLIVQP